MKQILFSSSPFFLSPYKIDGFLVNKITCSPPIRKFACCNSSPALPMLRQKFVSPPTNRDGIFNFESSKKWTHARTVLEKKKGFLLPYTRAANSWLATSRLLNVQTAAAAVGKRRPVHWSRLCLKIHNGSEKIKHLCLLHCANSTCFCHLPLFDPYFANYNRSITRKAASVV